MVSSGTQPPECHCGEGRCCPVSGLGNFPSHSGETRRPPLALEGPASPPASSPALARLCWAHGSLWSACCSSSTAGAFRPLLWRLLLPDVLPQVTTRLMALDPPSPSEAFPDSFLTAPPPPPPSSLLYFASCHFSPSDVLYLFIHLLSLPSKMKMPQE